MSKGKKRRPAKNGAPRKNRHPQDKRQGTLPASQEIQSRFACPDCDSVVQISSDGTGLFLWHDETCPTWRARAKAVGATDDDTLILRLIDGEES